MSDYMEDINNRIANGAKSLLDSAIDTIAKRLPNDGDKKKFLESIDYLEEQGIRAVINGEDYRQYIERGAYETSVWLANHYADAALNRVAKNFPRGKAKNEIVSALRELSRTGIEGLCSGNSAEQIKASLADCAKEQIKEYVKNNSKKWASNVGDSMYKLLKTSGKGSRKTNRYIRSGTNMVAEELGEQIVVNFSEYLSGGKDFTDAAIDTVAYTAKNAGERYVKSQGAELAASAIKELAKRAEKEIENRALCEAATKGLGKLTNANAVLQAADIVYDVGKALKQLANGEITKTEFLRIVGEKGTAFVVSGVYSSIGAAAGMAIAGPVGAGVGMAIGSAMGYISTSLLYNSVLKAFDDAEISRKRYEMVHEFCEYSIAEMERERQEFVRITSELFANRQRVIENSLDRYEAALQNNNVNELAASLNEIAKEFGGELQFKNMDEFDKFMLDDSKSFEL